jgi:sialidase-1
MRNVVKISLCVLLVCMTGAANGYTLLYRTAVFESGETIGGVTYSCFRIPAVVRANDGSLLAFAEGRVSDCSDEGNIDIVMRRSTDGGYSWSSGILVDSDGIRRLHNPVPVVESATGKVFVVYGRDANEVLLKSSTNNGASWSSYVNISSSVTPADATDGIAGTGPSHGIQLIRGTNAGRLLIPYRYGRKIRMAYSDDGGTTWGYTHRIWGKDQYGINEVCIEELTNGNIYFNMRNQTADEDSELYRIVCQSSNCLYTGIILDANVNAFDTELPDPICAASVLKIRATDQGDTYNHILFANPASEVYRKFMTIKSSFNETGSWTRKKIVTTDYSGYSDMVNIGNGDIGILYETGSDDYHERVDFVLFGESWLSEPEVATYEFEEKSVGSYAYGLFGDNVYNNTCFGLHGEVTGAIKYVTGPNLDKALEFTSGDHITIDDTYTNNALDFYAGETFYIGTKIKTTNHGSGGAGDSGAIIAKDGGSTVPSWWLRVQDGYVKFLVSDGTVERIVTSTVKVNDGSWHYIYAGRDAPDDLLKIYIDGTLRGSITDTTTGSSKSDTDITIGNFTNASRQFLGQISFIRVYLYE